MIAPAHPPAAADWDAIRALLRRLDPPRVTLECRAPPDDALLARLRERLAALGGRAIAIDVQVRSRLATGASLRFGSEARLDLDPEGSYLSTLARRLDERPVAGDRTLADRLRAVSETISATEATPRLERAADRGRVLQVGDGVAIVDGLRDVRAQELVRFEAGLTGIAFDLLDETVGCLLLGAESRLAEGSVAERTGELLTVPVGDALVGRVVDALGAPLDGRGPITSTERRPIEAIAPGVVQRLPVAESLHTGIRIVDALVPLGRGQRELILGDRKIGKTTLALDVILAQAGAGVTCVYCAIGQKASSLAAVLELLQGRGAMEYTIVVAALAGDPPGFRYVAPYAACAIAEQVMRRGGHALVVYDDLSKHAVTYREISALLRRPIGREAYPGDIFYVHSRLLERAARMRDDLGGGSLTAIPIVETLAGDISALIPTNVISICDGQIFLDAALFNEGARPAMDVGLSVSRVGGMARTPAMRTVAGRLRIDLTQHHEMSRFVKFGAEVDAATLQQLRRGERELEVLKQSAHSPLPLEREIVMLLAAVDGHLDAVPVDRIRDLEQPLFEMLEREYADELRTLRETHELTPATQQRLGRIIDQFVAASAPKAEAPSPARGATG